MTYSFCQSYDEHILWIQLADVLFYKTVCNGGIRRNTYGAEWLNLAQ